MFGWLARLKIVHKLALGFCLILLLMGATMAVNVSVSVHQSALAARLAAHYIPARAAARDIVLWVRAADDDGAWYVMARNPAQAATLLRTYYAIDVPGVRRSMQRALALADTAVQRQALQRFAAYYYGTGGYTAAQERGLDRSSHLWSGFNGYLAGNEAVFALKRAGHMQAAYDGYVSVPYVPSLQAAQVYIDVVEREVAQTTQQERTAAQQSLLLSVALGLLALGIGSAIALVLARSIAHPVQRLTAAAEGLAGGDIAVEASLPAAAGGEIGRLTTSFRAMVAYQRTMAGTADAIARGELSGNVQPHSERDVLGTAFQRMTANLRATAATADRIARGELTADVRPQSEHDVLGVAFQRMIVNLRQLVGELQQGTHNLASAGDEILAMAAQHASGANEQSAAIVETTATVDQVKASAEHTVQLAEVVTETAKQATRIATDGVAAVRQATDGMQDIRHKVHSIADNILALSEQSQQIGEIITTVNDLADQSNLLALNAAIEASRAGEQGKGFTVVANEIRTLAEQSKAATAQVRTLLSDIQRATNAAVMATEQGTKGVDAGTQVIDQTGQTIDELAEAIQQAADSAAQIAASVWQHSVGMEQIAAAMGNINQATTQGLAATRNTQQAAQHLTDLAGRLSGLVVQYQL